MTMREIQKYIEAERAKLQAAIEINTESREQEVNRRLKQRDEEWLGEIQKYCLGLDQALMREGWTGVGFTQHLVGYFIKWAKGEG